MSESSEIFKKVENDLSLSKTDLQKMIPGDCNTDRDEDMETTHTEWRWRILKIGKTKYIEISFKNPGEKRKYINLDGDWVDREISDEFDRFVVKHYYKYTKDDE